MRRRKLSSIESAPPSPTRVDNLPLSHYYDRILPEPLEIIIPKDNINQNETEQDAVITALKINKSHKPKKKKKARCRVCRKKLGMIPFKCRCEKLFCSKHRYSDVHQCEYDYKSSYTEKYIQNNPQIIPDKIIHI